jgi:hypothetical protein
VKGTFSQVDQEKNAKLLVDMTGRGLGMSAKAFKEIPEIKYAKGPIERLKEALKYVANNVVFPVELPAFDPSICQTLMTDKNVLETYDEFPEGENQMLFAGGPGGTIWMAVSPDFPVGTLHEPFSVIGFTSADKAVIRQSYIKFLRQFLPDPET